MKGCNQYTGGKNDTAVAFTKTIKNPPGGKFDNPLPLLKGAKAKMKW